MKISPAVKVGILTLISVILFVFCIMWLKGRSISAGERIEIKFKDVDGLRPGSAVQMMGIRVGQIDEIIPVIDPSSSFVRVRFVITEPSVSIPNASTISIQQSGIIGEKFIEITPPQIQNLFLPVNKGVSTVLEDGSPISILLGEKYINVGLVKKAQVMLTRNIPQQVDINTPYCYKIDYILTRPGVIVSENSVGRIHRSGKKHEVVAMPSVDFYLTSLNSDDKYTVIEPMRLKKFFDIQLRSAEALEETNRKINTLLSDESINDLKAVVRNTKVLTAKASVTVDEVNNLIKDSNIQLKSISALFISLSGKIAYLTDNLNGILGDPSVKNDMVQTINSLQKSINSISLMIEDIEKQGTLTNINETAENLSEITSYVNALTKDKNFQNKLDSVITNLDSTLENLNYIMDGVKDLKPEDRKKFKEILDNSAEISKNLKKFSRKLNKNFLLFRLMF